MQSSIVHYLSFKYLNFNYLHLFMPGVVPEFFTVLLFSICKSACFPCSLFISVHLHPNPIAPPNCNPEETMCENT